MPASVHRAPTDATAFARWEDRQRQRYELIGGVVRMMTGGTLGRDLAAANVTRALGNAVAGSRCSVHGSNVKIVAPAGTVMYPDAFVRCGAGDGDATSIDDPVLVVEVESPSTKRYDMNKKRCAYRSIPSLRHLVLIPPRRCLVELVARDAERAGSARWSGSSTPTGPRGAGRDDPRRRHLRRDEPCW